MKTEFVLFKIEGDDDRVDRKVRDLLAQWSTERRCTLDGKEKHLLLDYSAEICPESMQTFFQKAREARGGTTLHQLIHPEEQK